LRALPGPCSWRRSEVLVSPGWQPVLMASPTGERYSSPVDSDSSPVDRDSFTVDCDSCTMHGTATCSDCVVTFICDRSPDDAIVFDVAEERALRMLMRGGLVPPLRHNERTGLLG